jgi:arylsulfatase A-like enzyme
MLATLEKQRMLDDTVVVFRSDHGYRPRRPRRSSSRIV